MAYGKLNTDGTLISANTKIDDTFVSLDLFSKDENGDYYEFYNEDYTPNFTRITQKAETKAKQELKTKAKESITKIIVTTSNGTKFYADPISRTDLSDAIAIMVESNISEYLWKTIDGVKLVTLEDMKEARKLGLLEKGRLVGAVS